MSEVETMRTPGILALTLLISVNAAAELGDILYIQGEGVNVREGPSTNTAVTLKLGNGHRLMELGRNGDWVRVHIDRTGGKEGWVHEGLVSSTNTGGKTIAPPDPRFDQFKLAVEQINKKVKSRGFNFFPDVENMGDGIVQITVTDIWLSTSKSDRQTNLNSLFELWSAAEGTGRPIMVQMVDQYGNVIMQRARR